MNFPSFCNDCRNHQFGGEGVWLHHSRYILLPLIETRDKILIQYCTIGKFKGDTFFTKQRLDNQQQGFNNSIDSAKYYWWAYQSERIHSMRSNTKEALQSVKTLYCGETSHHKNITIMMMQLPNGSTATTDTDNALVLVPHFAKVFFCQSPSWLVYTRKSKTKIPHTRNYSTHITGWTKDNSDTVDKW